MVTEKTISAIRQTFSRYFADETCVPRYVWLHPESDSDDCETTVAVNDPLNGLESVDCSQTYRTEVTAETKEEEIQLSFDHQKEDEIVGPDQTTPESAILTESALSVNYVADGTIENLIRDFGSFENCTDNQLIGDVKKSVDTNEAEGNCVDISNQEIDDDGQGSTVSAQLSKFIKIYEHKECTNATTVEIESLIGEQNAQPRIEATENNSSEPLNAVPSGAATVSLQHSQQLLNAQNEPCLLDLTDLYEVVQDPRNPTLFSIREKPTKDLKKILAQTGNLITVPICFNGDIILPSNIPLKDCLNKPRKKNPLEGKNFFVENLKTVIDWKPRTKRLKRRPEETATKTSKKKKNKLMWNRNKSANGKTTVVNVVEAPPNPIEYIVPDHRSVVNSVPETPTILIEQRTVTVNEWLQESSQVQPDNNVDVSVFFQDTNLPVLSDIEDDAFHLAELIRSRNSYSVNPTASQSVEASHNQPLDLSVKQSTPISTDTGFCNGSFALDATPPRRSGADTNAGMNGNQNYHADQVNENGTDEKTDLMENDLRMKLNENKNILSPTPLTTIPAEFKIDQTDDLKSEIGDRIMDVAHETDKPMPVECIFQPNPQAMDWKDDNYSTDLDYEPSEDEKDELIDNDIQQKSTYQRNEPSIQRRRTTKTWKSLVIEVPNNPSSSRSMVASSSARSDTFPSTVAQTNAASTSATSTHQEDFPFHLMQPATETSYSLITEQMRYLFNRMCFNYLKGGLCTAKCKFNHKLPESSEVLNKLQLFSNDTIWAMYNHFIAKCQITFVRYFPVICEIFSKRNIKTALLAAVQHCERRNKLSYYAYIYDGLVLMNVSKLEALTKIGQRCCKSRDACTELMNFIVKDPLHFIDLLRKYYRHANIKTHHMLKMLRQIKDNPSPSLLTLFVDIFDQYSLTDVRDIAPYRAIYYETRKLTDGDVDLKQKLYQIALRDGRISF